MIRIFKPTDTDENGKADEEATKEEYEAYLKAKEEDKLHAEDKPS